MRGDALPFPFEEDPMVHSTYDGISVFEGGSCEGEPVADIMQFDTTLVVG